jgi:hypothetical protein
MSSGRKDTDYVDLDDVLAPLHDEMNDSLDWPPKLSTDQQCSTIDFSIPSAK